MKYQKICECCGGRVKAFTHKINKPMLIAFVKLIEYYLENKKAVNINKDLGLDHNQKCNLPKMQYYDLIEGVGKGGWLPTEKGMLFYKGEITVLTPAATMANKVLSEDHEAWRYHKKKRERVFIHELKDWKYKRREEYAGVMNTQNKLPL